MLDFNDASLQPETLARSAEDEALRGSNPNPGAWRVRREPSQEPPDWVKEQLRREPNREPKPRRVNRQRKMSEAVNDR